MGWSDNGRYIGMKMGGGVEVQDEEPTDRGEVRGEKPTHTQDTSLTRNKKPKVPEAQDALHSANILKAVQQRGHPSCSWREEWSHTTWQLQQQLTLQRNHRSKERKGLSSKS